jgi:hypothetical protein
MDVSGQLHAPAALPPGKEPLVTYWIGGWVGPRAGTLIKNNEKEMDGTFRKCLKTEFRSNINQRAESNKDIRQRKR